MKIKIDGQSNVETIKITRDADDYYEAGRVEKQEARQNYLKTFRPDYNC